jgi:hypothetical protein
MMLVYNLPQVGAIFDRFGGINGSAYFIGGFGMTALTANNIVVVPIRSGIGLRLGANLGYLKFTDSPTFGDRTSSLVVCNEWGYYAPEKRYLPAAIFA